MTASRARFQKNDILPPDVYEGWLADVEDKDSEKVLITAGGSLQMRMAKRGSYLRTAG